MKTDIVMLNFCQWFKTRSSAFSQKFSATTPNFLHFFGRAPSDLQLCFVQLKTLAPSARYSTFKYPVTLKPGLAVTQGHWKCSHVIEHIRLPMALSHVVSQIFNVEKCRDLEIGVRGHSRSLKVVPFGRPCMVSY